MKLKKKFLWKDIKEIHKSNCDRIYNKYPYKVMVPFPSILSPSKLQMEADDLIFGYLPPVYFGKSSKHCMFLFNSTVDLKIFTDIIYTKTTGLKI